MKKIVLIDGNNLMFRAYYATAYTGNLMKNSKGLVTNALYGFTNMINKIISEENPEYMAVCFDIGKTFRHEEYDEYKAGRSKTPDELKIQMPIAKELLEHMGIVHLEVEGYEADDIVGTLSKRANLDPEWIATLVTSDHDYLQLITDQVEVKLLQTKGFTRYNPTNFFEDYGIEPIRIIDLKALMGDSSDNIPGVPGVGEKTALKLLVEHKTLDGIYENIDSIKGKLQEKLINGKDSAYFSYKLATINCDVPNVISFDDMKYNGPKNTLDNFFHELEFYSLMGKQSVVKKPVDELIFKELENVSDITKDNEFSYYIECDNDNYHTGNIIGMGIYDEHNVFYVKPEMINDVLEYVNDIPKYTYDLKKNIVLLKSIDTNTIYDLNIAAYLLNKTLKDDIAIIMNQDDIEIPLYKDLLKSEKIKEMICKKAKYIYDSHEKYVDDLKSEEMYDLFDNVEMPLVTVLAKMEMNGIICNSEILDQMNQEIESELKKLEIDIYNLAGHEFNIASPLQLGVVLFEELGLKHGKKTQKGYSTASDVLEKLVNDHEIINKILEYRNLAKLSSTYLIGLKKYILDDKKIHTIYKQTLTRTGRLSSVEPNLQNIPARDELGRKVRKAFIPENDFFASFDYSQIELRILSHISDSKELQEAFIKGDDIHTKVAADIFDKSMGNVTKQERRIAKSVIFGIVYGISGFGLGENIGVSSAEAKKFINKYYELYPGVKKYMDMIVKDAYECGYVRTLYKRKRVIDELFSSNFMVRQSGERIALNTPIQGTGADILKMAMVNIDKAFVNNKIKSKMLLQIHDELVFDVVESEKEKVVDIVKTIMESIVKLNVPLSVSSDFGTDLYETK